MHATRKLDRSSPYFLDMSREVVGNFYQILYTLEDYQDRDSISEKVHHCQGQIYHSKKLYS